MNKNTNTTTR